LLLQALPILQQILINLLATIGADRLSQRMGLAPALGKQRLFGLVGLVVYALILIPVLIAALKALVALEAITSRITTGPVRKNKGLFCINYVRLRIDRPGKSEYDNKGIFSNTLKNFQALS